MKAKSKILLMLLAVILVPAVKAQEAQTTSFSLKQAIEYAEKHSPNFKTAQLSMQDAEYQRKEIRGAGLPQVNASVDVKDYIEIPTSLIPGDFVGQPGTYIPVKFGTKYNATAGVSASQLVFSSDYIFALKASKEFLNLSKINLNRSKAEMVAAVSKAYYTAIIHKEQIKIVDANIVRLKKGYDDIKAMNQQGMVEAIDVERVEVSYNNLLTEKSKLEKLIGISENFLRFQMGYKLTDPIQLTDSIVGDANNYSELSVSKIDVTQRPDYMLLKTQQGLLELDVKRQKYGYLPTIAAYGSYQFNRQGNQFDFFTTNKADPTKQWFKIAVIGAQLNLSIFDGFQRHNRIQRASIAAQKNYLSLQSVEMGSELEANSAIVLHNNALSTMKIQKRNMELSEHVFDVAQKKYMSGVGSNVEVLNAETAMKESQTNYLNAVYDLIMAKIDYEKSTGTLK